MAMGCAGVLHNTTRCAGLCIPSDAPAAVNCCRRSCSAAVPGAAGGSQDFTKTLHSAAAVITARPL